MEATTSASARMEQKILKNFLIDPTMGILESKLVKPESKVTAKLSTVKEEDVEPVETDNCDNVANVSEKDRDILTPLMSGPKVPSVQVGEQKEKMPPTLSRAQTAMVYKSPALARMVAEYEVVSAERPNLGSKFAKRIVAKEPKVRSEKAATESSTSTEQDSLRKAKDWAEFQKAMRPVRARKAAELAAMALSIIKAEALDSERLANEDAGQVAEATIIDDDYELIDEADTIDSFEVVEEKEDSETYVVVDLTAAKNVDIRPERENA